MLIKKWSVMPISEVYKILSKMSQTSSTMGGILRQVDWFDDCLTDCLSVWFDWLTAWFISQPLTLRVKGSLAVRVKSGWKQQFIHTQTDNVKDYVTQCQWMFSFTGPTYVQILDHHMKSDTQPTEEEDTFEKPSPSSTFKSLTGSY